MGLTFPAKGTLTTSATETQLFAQVATDGLHSCKVHLEAMLSGDTYVFKVYNYDAQDDVERLFDSYSYSDAQTSPTVFFDFIPSTKYRVTVQRTAGTDKEISWERILVT